ncbi:hypothetical protein [Streptomyces sp. NBC_00076]|uniref:hypothetical protein n=1 Tax=Streptomyces sp. NBC_00076 TaxID=2975642 RepID=UPI00325390AC
MHVTWTGDGTARADALRGVDIAEWIPTAQAKLLDDKSRQVQDEGQGSASGHLRHPRGTARGRHRPPTAAGEGRVHREAGRTRVHTEADLLAGGYDALVFSG